MPYKGGVQLLPETRRERARKVVAGNKLVYWGIAVGTVVLVLNIIMSAYAANLNDQIATVHGQLRLQEDRRDEDAEGELQAAQRQSQLMNQLLRSHVYWGQALGLIAGLMQANVTVTDLSADSGDGTVDFTARGSNYAAVARQIASFNAGSGVTDVELTNVQANPGGGVEFSGTITVDVADVIRHMTPAASSAQ